MREPEEILDELESLLNKITNEVVSLRKDTDALKAQAQQQAIELAMQESELRRLAGLVLFQGETVEIVE